MIHLHKFWRKLDVGCQITNEKNIWGQNLRRKKKR